MAPAEVETFILGKGSNQQTVESAQEFEVGTIQAKVTPHMGFTMVKISGQDLRFIFKQKSSRVSVSGNVQADPLEVFLETGEFVEIRDRKANRIRVIDTK